MIPVPDNVIQIDAELVAYKGEFKGKTYIHIRTTYADKETGEIAIGKGLSLSPDQWNAFRLNFDNLCKGLE